ncbi:SET domain [Dillenia turbinata]|uniref:SET domain n=1 Tax=Dillenia turbinata TaxID=194707 RepID=A0AAN8WB68_9MAGN
MTAIAAVRCGRLQLKSSLCKLQNWSSSSLLSSRSFSDSASVTTESQKQQIQEASPPPIRVGFTESAGRGVFATRSIKSGELVHTAKPIVSHPSFSSLQNHNVCYFCLKKISSQHAVSFCSSQCRDQAQAFYDIERKVSWAAFDDYCRNKGLKYPHLVKRLACMVISGVASADCLDILQPASLSSEMLYEPYLLQVNNLLRDCFTLTCPVLTKKWYTNVLARIRINAFRVELACGSYEDLLSSAVACVNSEAAIGNAVYLLPSLYNHDCDPNTHIIWIENVDARLKALRDIDEGEELRICYIDASMDHNARQALLSAGFGFQCCCLRCLSGD